VGTVYGRGRGRVNPIHQKKDGKWCFWDEVWSDELGNYDTEEEARKGLREYCEWLGKKEVKCGRCGAWVECKMQGTVVEIVPYEECLETEYEKGFEDGVKSVEDK